MEDTSSKPKDDYVNGIEENQPNLFADNRNPSKGIQLYKIMGQSDIIEVEPGEVHDVIEAWAYSLVAFVVGGFPGLRQSTSLPTLGKFINFGLIQKHKAASSGSLTSENNTQQKHASKPAELEAIYGADGQFSRRSGEMESGLNQLAVSTLIQGDRKKALRTEFLAVYLLQRMGLIGAQKSQENSSMMQGVSGQQHASLMQAVFGTIAAKLGIIKLFYLLRRLQL
ncbi:hypothetical protein M9H77_36035 [Catharanthus roseus]|uniref:Uncharacterized protein n=1 Tax=Catharanthus roseus TaxID=4058 RepID=A0ACB9ZQZ9_CATRO|nr:hypothetical protein M9H77_36035 [Catharanthus roseus]